MEEEYKEKMKQATRQAREEISKMFQQQVARKEEKPLTEKQKIALELLLKQREMQIQFLYFWMALNASAIAFGISTTVNTKFDLSLWFMIASIACWALSFLLGIFILIFQFGSNQMDIAFFMNKASKKEMEEFKELLTDIKQVSKLMLLCMATGMGLCLIWYFKTLK